MIDAEIENRLLPFVGRITTLTTLLEILGADGEPLPWFASNGAIRAAHIVSIAMQLGLPPMEIQRILKPYARWVVQKPNAIENAESYVSNLIEDWDLRKVKPRK